MLSIFFSVFLLQATYIDLFNNGHALLDQGKPKEAEMVLKESASLKPGYVPTLKALGEVYAKLGRLPEAIEQYEKAVKASPRDLRARGRLAELYSWAGNHDKSIVSYKDALELDPGNILLKNGLATVLRWSHRHEEAERLYREVLAVEPNDRDALKGLGKTYAMTGDLSGASEVLLRAIKLYPDDAELYKEMGTVLSWRRDFKEAQEYLDKAIELRPDYPEAVRTQGDVYLWMRDFDSALASYRKAADIEPGNVENYLLLARVYRQMDNLRMAEESVKAALRIDPGASGALELLRELRSTGSVRYTVVRTLGEAVEFGVFFFVFILLFITYRRRRRMLLRRHRLYFYFSNVVLPALVVITFVSFLGKETLTRWVGTSVVEDVMEAVLFFTLGVSMLALLWTERRSNTFSKTVVLVIGAHPDDIELGCGGYIMKLKDGGGAVYGLTMSRGEKGAQNAEKREEELRKAARFMELDGFWHLDFPDTRLDRVIYDMKDRIEDKIKETGATVVLTHTAIDTHSDHRAVFEASKVAARNISILCYEDVSTPREFIPNYFADITEYMEDKAKLVSLHRTQGDKTYMDPEVVKGRAAHRGLQANVQYAEAFKVYKLLR
ncbi:MAG: tetratricopeptide repeat protein [Thermodesulfobacteriota bacterium]